MIEPGYQPHYRQIEQALRERIATMRPGARLPSDAAATAPDTEALDIPLGSPLFVRRRVIVDTHRHRIEPTESRYPAERYGLVVHFDVDLPGMAER